MHEQSRGRKNEKGEKFPAPYLRVRRASTPSPSSSSQLASSFSRFTDRDASGNRSDAKADGGAKGGVEGDGEDGEKGEGRGGCSGLSTSLVPQSLDRA